MHGSHGKHEHHEEVSSDEETPETFQELTDKNKAYKDGYIEGIKVGRKENESKENNNER